MDQYGQQGNYGQQQAPPPYPQQGQYGQQQAPPPYPPQQGGYLPPATAAAATAPQVVAAPAQDPDRTVCDRRSVHHHRRRLGRRRRQLGQQQHGQYEHGHDVRQRPAGRPGRRRPHIGQPAADGKLRFVVTRISHTASVGDTADGFGETADGRFTVLHIRVTNISSQSQTLDDSARYVYDAQGRKFDADTAADLDANPGNGGGSFLNDINPGNSVSGVILFDLPRGDKAVKAELHDSVFSGGVMVALHH